MRLILTTIAATLVACGGSGPSNADTLTAIGDIQGAGSTSPLEGRDVTIEGVVTGDFQEGDGDTRRNLGGFYVQGAPDGDDDTSDGIFVFDGARPQVDVKPGDRVRVTGSVTEFFGETQIAPAAVAIVGAGDVEPAPVSLPVGTRSNGDGELIADLEAYEGMLVRFPQVLTVSQLRNLERFGEVLLSAGGRPFSFTNAHPPDVPGYAAHLESVAARRIHLDDGRRDNNPGVTLALRNGDEIRGLTGVVRYSRGAAESGTAAYRLMPTLDPEFDNSNPRPPVPAVGGSLRVATFNVNNFFATPDGNGPVCGPTGEDSCRGADSDAELSRQLAKIVTVLGMLDADIVALIELENDAGDSLQMIVEALNASRGRGTFAFVDTGPIGSDAIKVGLIYKPAAVRTVGDFALLDNSVDVRFNDARHRPVLAQTFESRRDAGRFTVLALHLKSKGSSCEPDGDPDVGDGQGNCSATRSLAAAAMIDWITSDPTSSGDADYLIIGDFNTHTMGDALSRLERAGYVNVAAAHIGAGGYSFEFDGQFGSLDHALASPTLAPQVSGAADWHINADEAPANDYNLEFGRDPARFDPSSPYRASDHDPLIIGLEFPP